MAGGVGFFQGHLVGGRVDGGGGGEDDVFNSCFGHCLGQNEGGIQVVVVVPPGDTDTFAHGLQTGEVDDGVDVGILGEDGIGGGRIAQIGLDEGDGLAGDFLHTAQRLLTGVGQIVHHDDLITCVEQLHAGVAADVTGAAAD